MARSKRTSPDQPTPPESLTYEQAVAELETIIDLIERGEIGLEESLRQYERGDALVRRCDAVLRGAEQRIEHLDRARLAELDEASKGGTDARLEASPDDSAPDDDDLDESDVDAEDRR